MTFDLRLQSNDQDMKYMILSRIFASVSQYIFSYRVSFIGFSEKLKHVCGISCSYCYILYTVCVSK